MNETAQALEYGAFKHIVVPIGVIIGLGVARIVGAVSEYIQKRDRVRFSSIHAVWAAALFLTFVMLWWTLWGLRSTEESLWSFFTLIYLLTGPVLIFVPSILMLPEVPDSGELDLARIFDRVGRPFFLCLAGYSLWIAYLQLHLLAEPFLTLSRALQGGALLTFLVGAAFPSRRVAAGVGIVLLIVVGIATSTVRAQLG
ncbi:MAG: hypothetical protein ACYTG5_06800 [Planctomycetota bacterium]|jgi:hypothetical protein